MACVRAKMTKRKRDRRMFQRSLYSRYQSSSKDSNLCTIDKDSEIINTQFLIKPKYKRQIKDYRKKSKRCKVGFSKRWILEEISYNNLMEPEPSTLVVPSERWTLTHLYEALIKKDKKDHSELGYIAGVIQSYFFTPKWDVQPLHQSKPIKYSAFKSSHFPLPTFPRGRSFLDFGSPLSICVRPGMYIDVVASITQTRRRTWSLYRRHNPNGDTVKIGEIPSLIGGEWFASELSGLAFDLQRNLVWLFSLRRIIAVDISIVSRSLHIIYNIPHQFDKLKMKYSTEHDSLEGNWKGYRVRLTLS